MGPSVVVVVDDECAEEVAGGRKIRNGVAVLLAGGDWEETEGLLVPVAEAQRLRHDSGGAAAEVAVGEPRRVELVGGIRRTSAVDVVRQTCEFFLKKKLLIKSVSERECFDCV